MMLINADKKLGFVAVTILVGLLSACSEAPVKPEKQSELIAPTLEQSQIETQEHSFPDIAQPAFSQSTAVTPVLTELPGEVASVLNQTGLTESGLSAYIYSLTTQQPVLEFNADVPRNPASVMKLITTYASLGILGPDYRWPIEFYTNGYVSGNTLNGDLILKGYGYPNFKPQDLRALLNDLRGLGIQQIHGNLAFDNTYFRITDLDPGAFDGKPHAFYNALPDALLYNERISEFVIKPQANTIRIFSPVPAYNINIVNNLRAKNTNCTGRYASPAMRILPNGKKINVEFAGDVSTHCNELKYASVITDPINMLFSGIVKIWTEEMGGTIDGQQMLAGMTPPDAKLISRMDSQPVSEVLPLINKDSNNVMARQLFLSLGAKYKTSQATTEDAAQAVQDWFTSRGLQFPELRLENGCGLSRIEQISAKHIGQLLVDAYHSPYRDYLIKSLPIMGVDGTLKKRMKGTVLENRGFFKTGTLNNTRALAGYLQALDGKVYAIAIIHNDPQAKNKARPVHDKLVEWAATRL